MLYPIMTTSRTLVDLNGIWNFQLSNRSACGPSRSATASSSSMGSRSILKALADTRTSRSTGADWMKCSM
jgi:hypothetical protein